MAELIGRIYLSPRVSEKEFAELAVGEYHFADETKGRTDATVCGLPLRAFDQIIGEAEHELIDASRHHEWLEGLTACATCFASED